MLRARPRGGAVKKDDDLDHGLYNIPHHQQQSNHSQGGGGDGSKGMLAVLLLGLVVLVVYFGRLYHSSSSSAFANNYDPSNYVIDCSLTDPDCINQIVNDHPVVVFSKPSCPFCRGALQTLNHVGVSKPFVVDLSAAPENKVGKAVQMTLAKMTGRSTVPNVFIGGASIGGRDETLAAYHDGELRRMLKAAKAV